MKIGLLGKIPKGDKERASFMDWKLDYVKTIKAKIPSARILHGDEVGDEIGPELVVGNDLWIVKNADVLIVDAREKIGAGTAQEIVLAKYFRKPVICVIPKNTHYRRSNLVFNAVTVPDWIHPFLAISSDYVAENIEEAVKWISEKYKSHKTKGIEIFDQAICRFESEMSDTKDKYSRPE